MKQLLVAIGVTIITSLFFFPFETALLPSVNTKMAMAAFAILLYIIRAAKFGNRIVNREIVILSLCAFAVSLIGYISTVINNTHDYTYATYFVSMWVWIGGGYVVIKTMECAYGKVTIRLVGNFLIAVCVTQCILAQIIDSNEVVKEFVDSFMVSTGFMGKHENRLYGIGCALDVAGLKFCTVLLVIAMFCITPISKTRKHLEQLIYMIAFFIIAIYGSMIARTTNVGVILSFILWGVYILFNMNNADVLTNSKNILKILLILIIIFIPIAIYLYDTNQAFHYNIRFAFEGFFSLHEEGAWNVGSNSRLEKMFIWPDNARGWIIGDGYFSTPQDDFYYVGPIYDYYKGTDVGYSRFIFYFGLLGLIAFSFVFIIAATICSKRFPKYIILFLMIAIMNFIGWIKVSSDIFPILALFLCIPVEDNTNENSLHNSLPI